MPRTTAKICGLSTPETLDAAVEGGASHVGFVFFPKSPRNVTLDQVRALSQRVPGHVAKTGVFVDPDDMLIDMSVEAGGLDVIQLHGKESAERAALLRVRTGRETWKALSIRTSADLSMAESYLGAVDRLVYDAKPPIGADLPGGLGLRFDWRLLDGFRHPLPWALSGGLDIENIAEAVGITGARLVDISSGVESAPGIKDVDKIAAFLKATAQL